MPSNNPEHTPEVVIIGAGIGGLCLAQGLRKVGIPVRVYERENQPGSRWEGYRIAINADGAAALEACLPEPLWQAFLATSGRGGAFGVLNPRLEPLFQRDEDEDARFAVDRATLRRLLLAGLDDVVHFGARFSHYEVDDERVVASFTDGRTATGDLLVGADGTRSVVRKQYLPHAEVVEAGVGGIAVKLPLTDATVAWLPERFRTGMNLITDGAGVALFTSAYNPPAGARAALEAATGPQPEVDFAPYVLGALNTDPARLPADLARLDADALRALGDSLIAGWHPVLRRVLTESEPATRGGLLFSVATETPPWPSTRVTLLGDALHTMPATGGLGGNTALHDARTLVTELAELTARPWQAVIPAYETELRAHGYAAVREALTIRDHMLGAVAAR
jgi:2-polyprenyl-6-methoxyphenol hydroxylase-like FAD-dependent oxidoreductase